MYHFNKTVFVCRRAVVACSITLLIPLMGTAAGEPPYARFAAPDSAVTRVSRQTSQTQLPPPKSTSSPIDQRAVKTTIAVSDDAPAYPGTQVLPVDLPTALRLADVRSPTVGLARARVQEVFYRLRQAQVQWLPNLDAGPTYQRHDGLLQTSRGEMVFVNKWQLFAGGGASLSLETSDALFAPLIARRLLDAQSAASRMVSDDVQLQVALTYLDLLRAYAVLAINAETLANALELQRLAESFDKRGFGKTPADANRARVEVTLRRQERARLIGEVGAVSARLMQLLALDPAVQLRPADPAVVPIVLVPRDTPLAELVATGWMNRPELAESRALVAASVARWRQARMRPFLPRLEASYLAGEFGGGLNDNSDRFGGRGDGTAQAVWTLHNFGAGDIANARATRSQVNQANLHVAEVQNQVAADVTAAASLAASRFETLGAAQRGVEQAEEMWHRLLKWTVEGVAVARRLEAVDLLLAEQALNQARMEYLSDVIEFNQQQFRLYWAMGQPPVEALAKAASVPVQIPVTPKPAASSNPR